MTNSLEEKKSIKSLIDHIGIGQSGSNHQTLMELMNFTLQCLGGIRLMTIAAEKEKAAIAVADQIKREEIKIDSDEAIREIFSSAVNKMLLCMTDRLSDLDPSKHLVESFPDENNIGCSHWLTIHWTLLGEELYDASATATTTDKILLPNSSSSSTNSVIIDSTPKETQKLVCDQDNSQKISQIDAIILAYPKMIDEYDKEGRSVLHYAARLSSVALVDCVMKYAHSPGGFGPADANLNGAFPLHNVARFSRCLSVTKHILGINPSIISCGNFDGTLPLHWAAAKNTNLDIIDCLIKANPEALQTANLEGYLPLHSAAQNLQLHIVKAVVDANPTAICVRDAEGGIPLHHACCFNTNLEVIKYMHALYPEGVSVAQSDGIIPLHLAASQNATAEVTKYLLEMYPRGAFVVDRDKWLPLHCLMSKDCDDIKASHIECLRLLIAANPQAVSQAREDGQTPYNMAIERHHRDTVLRLILFAQPNQDVEQFARLNWNSYRRLAVFAALTLHRSDLLLASIDLLVNNKKTKDIKNDTKSNNNDEDIDVNLYSVEKKHDNCIYVFRMLTNGHVGENGLSINSNVLRHIIKFL